MNKLFQCFFCDFWNDSKSPPFNVVAVSWSTRNTWLTSFWIVLYYQIIWGSLGLWSMYVCGIFQNNNIMTAQPFARPQDMNPSNVITTKLARIQDYILKRYDLELHAHLENFEIAPQIYGMWVVVTQLRSIHTLRQHALFSSTSPAKFNIVSIGTMSEWIWRWLCRVVYQQVWTDL